MSAPPSGAVVPRPSTGMTVAEWGKRYLKD